MAIRIQFVDRYWIPYRWWSWKYSNYVTVAPHPEYKRIDPRRILIPYSWWWRSAGRRSTALVHATGVPQSLILSRESSLLTQELALTVRPYLIISSLPSISSSSSSSSHTHSPLPLLSPPLSLSTHSIYCDETIGLYNYIPTYWHLLRSLSAKVSRNGCDEGHALWLSPKMTCGSEVTLTFPPTFPLKGFKT